MNFKLRLESQCSSVSSSSRPPGELPAQVTRMSIWPKRPRVSFTQRSTSSALLVSPASATMVRPVLAAISLATCANGPAVLAVITMSAPSEASCSATALPMPLLAPVTNAILPVNPRSMTSGVEHLHAQLGALERVARHHHVERAVREPDQHVHLGPHLDVIAGLVDRLFDPPTVVVAVMLEIHVQVERVRQVLGCDAVRRNGRGDLLLASVARPVPV